MESDDEKRFLGLDAKKISRRGDGVCCCLADRRENSPVGFCNRLQMDEFGASDAQSGFMSNAVLFLETGC